jgi:energy-coupling factor transporter ATP-binding protein EcfA2
MHNIVWITGQTGSGKSTLCSALSGEEYYTLDLDMLGFKRNLSFDKSGSVDWQKTQWILPTAAFKVAKQVATEKDVLLFGCASNMASLLDAARNHKIKVFYLNPTARKYLEMHEKRASEEADWNIADRHPFVDSLEAANTMLESGKKWLENYSFVKILTYDCDEDQLISRVRKLLTGELPEDVFTEVKEVSDTSFEVPLTVKFVPQAKGISQKVRSNPDFLQELGELALKYGTSLTVSRDREPAPPDGKVKMLYVGTRKYQLRAPITYKTRRGSVLILLSDVVLCFKGTIAALRKFLETNQRTYTWPGDGFSEQPLSVWKG